MVAFHALHRLKYTAEPAQSRLRGLHRHQEGLRQWMLWRGSKKRQSWEIIQQMPLLLWRRQRLALLARYIRNIAVYNPAYLKSRTDDVLIILSLACTSVSLTQKYILAFCQEAR